MNIAVAASNGITITTSMLCMSLLYQHHWRRGNARSLAASILIITLTVLAFGLQVTYPEILTAFRRDVEGLTTGEWWRLITPLFVQPHGWFQFFFNLVFLVVFLPIAERLYGARLWLLYFAPGVVGQLVNHAWLPDGGGSSTAVFGVMGSLLIYVLRHRKSVPRQYWLFATLGLCGAVVMCFTRDGHGPGLLTGALLAALPKAYNPRVARHIQGEVS